MSLISVEIPYCNNRTVLEVSDRIECRGLPGLLSNRVGLFAMVLGPLLVLKGCSSYCGFRGNDASLPNLARFTLRTDYSQGMHSTCSLT